MTFTTVDGVRIRYQVEGNGPPLLLHHGTGDCLESWHAYGYVDVLRQSYQLITFDARGQGASDKPHDSDAYTLERRVADVVAVLDELGIERAHYLGVSLGGWVGLGMATHAQARLRSATIVGAQPYGQSMEPYRQLLRAGIETWLAALEQMAGLPLPPEHRRRLLGNDVQALLASVTHDRPNIAAMLPTATVPCLLICGDQDPLYTLMEQCAAQLPEAEFAGMAGLNHMQAIVRSDVLLPHVTRFLANVSLRADVMVGASAR
jgi:pimeloyl-ACP methyl ester carboxylesterase